VGFVGVFAVARCAGCESARNRLTKPVLAAGVKAIRLCGLDKV
jgi:hypothetical protein